MAIEFATGYVSLIPSLKGAGKSISSQLGGINMAPIGAKMGNALGMKLGAGMKTSMKSQISSAIFAPVTSAIEKQSVATRNLGTAEMDLSKARGKQQSAQAKVATAEEKLATLREGGTATSGELKVAEADLNAAKVALADSNLRVGSSEDAATRAKEAATAANSGYIESLKKSSTVTGRLETALPVIGARIQEVGGQWKSAGKRIGGVGATLTKKITAPVGIAVTAVGGLTAALGWGRLVGLDSAQAQLKGLGYNTEEVGRISGQVTKAIEGGMTTMAEGTAVAAGALAAGVKEGSELEGYIQRVGNAAVGANRPVGEMAQIFNRVQGSGKLMTQELNMVEDGMPGFASAMAKSLGVPQAEFRKMVTAGEVSSKDFMGVMDDFAGGMAEASANSWDGLVKNTMAYVGIIGEALLGGVFGDAKTAIADFQGWLKSDDIQTWAADMGAKIGDTFGKIVEAVKGAITWWQNLSPAVKSAIVGFAGFLVVAGPILMVVGKIVMTIGGLITAFGSVVSAVGAAIPVIKALNVVMKANVIGIVITAIAALVAGLIWFFTQTDIGREIWGGFVIWLKELWTGVSTFFSELWTNITTFFTEAWANIVAFFEGAGPALAESWAAMWQGIADFFTGIWEGIKTFLGAAFEFIKNIFFMFHPVGIIIANWQPIKDFLVMLWEGIKTAVAVALAWIGSTIASISAGISSAWNATWSAIGAFLAAIWTGIKNAVGAAVNWVRDTVARVVNNIRSTWNTTWSNIGALLAAVWAGIKAAVSSAVNNVRSVISSVIRGIQSVWASVWGAIRSVFSAIWGNIVSAASGFMSSVRSKFQSVMDFIGGIPSKVLGFFSGIGSTLIASGRSLIGGFLDGIMAGFNRAKDAVAGGLSKIRNLFPFSPAKEGPFSGRGWVAYSGLSIGATFSTSVADSLHDGRKDITDELGGIQNEFDDFSNEGFRVSSSVPDYEVGAAGGAAGGTLGMPSSLINIEHMTVDSDVRVKQVSQDLWDRANRANRSRGKVALGGVVV